MKHRKTIISRYFYPHATSFYLQILFHIFSFSEIDHSKVSILQHTFVHQSTGWSAPMKTILCRRLATMVVLRIVLGKVFFYDFVWHLAKSDFAGPFKNVTTFLKFYRIDINVNISTMIIFLYNFPFSFLFTVWTWE